MNLNLCKDFEFKETSAGFLVVTPFRYEDNDQIVIFLERQGNGLWRVHDNGDAALHLMFDGIDPDNNRIQSWLAEQTGLVTLDEKENLLEICDIPEDKLDSSVMEITKLCAQFQAMTALRTSRGESEFKEEVMKILREVSEETGIEARFSVPVDKEQLFVVDCLFISPTPVGVFVAGSKERLLEAELAWSNLRRLGDPTRIYAVVEDPKHVGIKEVARANYFTDKTFQFREFETVFHDAIKETVLAH